MLEFILACMVSFLFLMGLVTLIDKEAVLSDKKYGKLKYALSHVFMFASILFIVLLIIGT
ncbi:MAG: hypothetical protein JSW73_03615 [Candidatus Woesearchaeota archaeon]|nr:MAG: hypothetical protein JSW73_03615 [Candidatus Woesearchaeota archaeon]